MSTSRPENDERRDARERIIATAYECFRRRGLTAVGVDRISAEAGVAKTTLYRHFRSKDELVLATIARHEEVWTAWLEQEAERRAVSPDGRMLAIFAALDDWYHTNDYEGCFFTNCLLETRDPSSPVGIAAVAALGNVYAFVRRLAVEAGAPDPDSLAHQIHLLMRGSIQAAVEGRFGAVHQAHVVARLVTGAQDAREGSTAPQPVSCS